MRARSNFRVAFMQAYPFIFSNERSCRIRRHLLFWGCWWAFQSFLYSFSAGIMSAAYFKRLPFAAIESLAYLGAHMFLAYSLIYWVVPRFILTGKIFIAVLAVLCLFLVTGAIASLTGIYGVQYFRELLLDKINTSPQHVNEINFFLGLLAGLRGAITIGGLAAAIKLMKLWYVKEQRNHQLEKENITSQLQLLKAQVHPHFLFNTLNTIYANTQVAAPPAAHMIMGLSHLLRYMLYECNKPLVPLEQELAMIREYIMLESERYGEDLDIRMDLPETIGDYHIAPLLLLPFVENCFKHGTSQVLEQQWISLQVNMDGDCIKMKLMNGKHTSAKIGTEGIGLKNVKQRLQLLYANKHELLIQEEEEIFIVYLKLQLQKKQTHHSIIQTALVHE